MMKFQSGNCFLKRNGCRYIKTKGCCYLSGEFVDFDKFEIEHKVPLSKGETNDFSNLYCACHIDNAIKHDIYPEDFMERISKIFMYQMGIRNGKGLKWKILHMVLKGMI
ncbi:MAG: HNH endonuclease [Lachnospiraceae bacterium]|nr:HNH endonuclease [Lachnospiraceae bacterium]